MLLSIFTGLYEGLIGPNPDYPEYRAGIFSSVGLFTLISAIVIAAVFYAGLGRWKPVFHRTSHWFLTLVLTAVLGFLFAFLNTRGTLAMTDSYTVQFALFNALYAALYFFLFSLLFKRFSIFAKHTPFKL